MEPEQTKPDQIEEINQHISDALDQWASIMLAADADEWAYHLEYSQQDLFNAVCIFNHVAQNIGIKNGTLDLSNIKEAGLRLKEVVKTLTGYDSAQLANMDNSSKIDEI